MALSSEEKFKLHSEINQLINQRFVVTTTGITVFGVFAAFLIPKSDGQVSASAVSMLYTGTAFVYVFLALLVYWACSLQNAIRMISQYLVQRKLSEWEVDVDELFSSSIPHGATYTYNVFYALGVASLVWPFAIETSIKSAFIDTLSARHWLVISCAVAYVAFVSFMVLVQGEVRRKQLWKNWELILKKRND